MTNLTAKEIAVLAAIDHSEYGDGITDPVWTFSIADNVDRDVVPNDSSLGGIVASLVKKGLVITDPDSTPEDDHCTGFTDEGVEAYAKAVGPENVSKWVRWDSEAKKVIEAKEIW